MTTTVSEDTSHPFVRAIADADISKESKKQYLRSLDTLRKLTGGTFEDIVRSPRAVYARISKAYDNNHTRKALVTSVKALFRHVDGLKDAAPDAFRAWHERYATLDHAIMDKVMNLEMSEREKTNWVPWDDVLRQERRLAEEEYGSFDHLVLAMYSLIEPLRQDFGNMRIFQAPPANPATYDKINYVIMKRDAETGGVYGTIVLNKFKTARKYKSLERSIPERLAKVICASLRKHPRDYLFIDERGMPYVKKNSYTKFSNRTLQRIFGKHVTVSTLRHSFISSIDFNSSTPRELFEASKNMAHSIAMQQLYRRRPGTDAPSPAGAGTTPAVSSSVPPRHTVVKIGADDVPCQKASTMQEMRDAKILTIRL
jgi:integrase